MWTTILDGREWHGVMQNRSKNGDFFWEYSSISPLTSADGTITKFIKTAEDITERRKLEAEAHSVKKLEATAILAGGMAHDFNNLLQVILGNISLAKQRAEPGSIVQNLLDVAERSSGQARELSQRLLTFAKGDDAFMHIAPLDRLIKSGVEAALNNSPIALELCLPADIPPVNIDEMQIQQVVTHLTVNAMEAMPNGGKLRIATCACSVSERDGSTLAPGEYVHVTFSDNGRGIQPDNLSRIFDPYFTTKQMASKKGMGLGLAVCHAIIRKHKGMITAESLPGEGATIHIYLPAAQKGVLSTAYTSSTT
jgi:signal transduction histidine kinase